MLLLKSLEDDGIRKSQQICIGNGGISLIYSCKYMLMCRVGANAAYGYCILSSFPPLDLCG